MAELQEWNGNKEITDILRRVHFQVLLDTFKCVTVRTQKNSVSFGSIPTDQYFSYSLFSKCHNNIPTRRINYDKKNIKINLKYLFGKTAKNTKLKEINQKEEKKIDKIDT